MNINQVERIRSGKGFLAALDQSGGRADGRAVQRNARGLHRENLRGIHYI